MLSNYFKLAFRNLKKRKGHTFINITGLAIAVAACLLIGIYIQFELSYDDFLEKGDRLYRVTQTSITPDKTYTSAATVAPLAANLEAEYSRLVEETVRFFNGFSKNWTFILVSGDPDHPVAESFLESDFYFVDSSFFEVFGFDLIRGNPETALDKPLSLVLTPQKARKFFGTEKAIGKTITLETGSMKMTVTGIMEPIPPNSHLNADILASFNSLNHYYADPDAFFNNWFVNNMWTYVLLKEGINPEDLSYQFPAFIKKYYASSRNENETLKLNLQPVESIHLYSDLDLEMQPNGSIFNIYLLGTAALLLLLIASINFMNLATAQASDRNREVGMRKALGAHRKQLVMQYMNESFLLTFIAFIVAILLVLLAMPFLNNIINEQLSFNPLESIPLLLGVIGLFIVLGTLSGFYPALYLSGFQTREIIQNSRSKGSGGSFLRKGLVIAQFAMSVILIIGTVIIFLQLQYMQQKNLGFNKDRLVIMPISQTLTAWEYPTFKKRAEQSSAILSVTGVSKILASVKQDSWKIAPAGEAGSQGETNFALWVTQDFIETFNLEVIAGRGFSKEFSADSQKGLLINQQMVQELGYENPRKALGSLFYFTTGGEKKPLRVIGVVNDFHYTSIKKQIKPTVIALAEDLNMIVGTINYAVAKIAPGRMKSGLTHLKKVWEDVNYIDPFSYSLQTEELAKVSASENTTNNVMRIFTVLCIIVACLGLFGLASFTASKRTKEIGIRKSMGATVGDIVALLNKKYVKLVLVANILAWPVIYFLSRQWLQDFPYRIELGWNLVLIFTATAVVSLLICLLTVSFHSVKAALINPVDSLRSE